MTQALVLSGVVFLVLTIVLSLFATHAYDNANWKANKNFKVAAWVSITLTNGLFLAAIWHHALTTGG